MRSQDPVHGAATCTRTQSLLNEHASPCIPPPSAHARAQPRDIARASGASRAARPCVPSFGLASLMTSSSRHTHYGHFLLKKQIQKYYENTPPILRNRSAPFLRFNSVLAQFKLHWICVDTLYALVLMFFMSRVYDFINLNAKLVSTYTIGFIIKSHIGFIPR